MIVDRILVFVGVVGVADIETLKLLVQLVASAISRDRSLSSLLRGPGIIVYGTFKKHFEIENYGMTCIE